MCDLQPAARGECLMRDGREEGLLGHSGRAQVSKDDHPGGGVLPREDAFSWGNLFSQERNNDDKWAMRDEDVISSRAQRRAGLGVAGW